MVSSVCGFAYSLGIVGLLVCRISLLYLFYKPCQDIGTRGLSCNLASLCLREALC